MIEARLDGFEKIGDAFRRITAAVERETERNVKRSLANIEAGAKRRCRVRTGRLRNSITHQVDPDGMDGTVGTNVDYAIHQHFGTGARGAASAAGRFGGSYDRTIAGQAANPFLFDAAEEERPKFVQRMEEDVRSALERVRT